MSPLPWWWRERRDHVTLGFTTRAGGESVGAYGASRGGGLNLAAHVGDAPESVERNRRRVVDDLVAAGRAGLPVRAVFMDQVHGAEVRVVTDDGQLEVPVPPTDGVVTTLSDLALFSLVADCAPVLLYAEDAGIVAAAHAGRPGMLAGVVPATVAAMRDLGANDIAAVVGPSVCSRCYEVPDSMRSDAAAIEPVSAAVTWSGTPAIDVAAGVLEQLRRERVAVTWVAGCTREETSLFSHRRDGRTGRFAGVVLRTEGTP